MMGKYEGGCQLPKQWKPYVNKLESRIAELQAQLKDVRECQQHSIKEDACNGEKVVSSMMYAADVLKAAKESDDGN